jgi:mRNA interferase MazF
MVKNYIPHAGDLVWLNFDPQAGREQSKRRPALVLSPKEYNRKTGLMLACPLTSQIKHYPFEVSVTLDDIQGAVLSDHVKSLDWKIRKAEFIQIAPDPILKAVKKNIALLMEL